MMLFVDGTGLARGELGDTEFKEYTGITIIAAAAVVVVVVVVLVRLIRRGEEMQALGFFCG